MSENCSETFFTEPERVSHARAPETGPAILLRTHIPISVDQYCIVLVPLVEGCPAQRTRLTDSHTLSYRTRGMNDAETGSGQGVSFVFYLVSRCRGGVVRVKPFFMRVSRVTTPRESLINDVSG